VNNLISILNWTELTTEEWPISTLLHVPEAIFQMRIDLSHTAATTSEASELNLAVELINVWPASTRNYSPEPVFQILNGLSLLADRISKPSKLKVAESTPDTWPTKTRMHSPVSDCHIRTVQSWLAVTI